MFCTLPTLRLFLLLVLAKVHFSQTQYVPPQALIEPLKPVGIRISIPHEAGISLVAFHVKFNEEFYGLEAGTISRDIIKQKNGRWTYEDRSTRLKIGDVVYYWINVIYYNSGYNLLDQEYRVKEFYDYVGQRIGSEDSGESGNNDGAQSCVYSTTKLSDPTGVIKHPCAGQLLFKEDFRDLAQLRRMQWTVVEQFSESPDYEFVVYRDNPENINVNNGLRITPKLLKEEYDDTFVREGNLTLTKCTGHLSTLDCQRQARGWNVLPPVSSGRINTKKSFNFEYGRIEIRAKFPRGDWIYPLLLLEPVNKHEKSSLERLQIRIAAAAGNEELRNADQVDISGRTLWGGVTGSDSQNSGDHKDSRATKYSREPWFQNFHVYELIWSSNRIVLKVDGTTYEDKQVNLPKDTLFYLTLAVAVGGVCEFPDNSVSRDYTKTWRNVEAKAMFHFYNTTDNWHRTWRNGTTSLEVDYIKIWAL